MKQGTIPTADLARDYTAGRSLLALERQYGLCHSAILYRLRRAGVTLRRKGAPTGNTNAKRQSKIQNRKSAIR